jgi:hypothetical protein
MSSKTIVCAACNAAVPYGRLSCPSCGELLASVAGAARPMVSAAVAMRAPTADRDARPAPAVLVDAPYERAAATGWDTPEPDDDWVDPGDIQESLNLAPSETTSHEPAWAEAEPAESADPVPPATEPAPPAADDEPQWPESRPPTPSAGPVAPLYGADAPGAYVPPVLPATPAGPPALARAWAGHALDEGAAPDADPGARTSAAALMDAARVPEFVGWLAVAGSAMAAIGFVLPWGMSVIGAAGVDYFGRWGLAGPFHPVVAIALLAVLGLAFVPNPIPLWVRVGLPGLGLGALLIGLIWPYLVGLPGRGPGVLVVGLGALILIVAGIVALAADRHGPEARAV